MKLVTLAANDLGAARLGLVVDGEIVDMSDASAFLPRLRGVPGRMEDLLVALDTWTNPINDAIDRLRGNASDVATQLRERGSMFAMDTETRLSPPVLRPGIVLSHVGGYHTHEDEMVGERPFPHEEQPASRLKNMNSLTGHGEPIVLPRSASGMVDFEGQFAVVFGRPCHDVSVGDAMATVAGYTVANDVCARDWDHRASGIDDQRVDVMGRQFPTFCPIGPLVATKEEIPDPHDITLTTRLNGKVMQRASTSDLVWSIPYLIAYFARWYRFLPGDMLMTGTPSGPGVARSPNIFMKAGDAVSVSISGRSGPIASLENPIRAQ